MQLVDIKVKSLEELYSVHGKECFDTDFTEYYADQFDVLVALAGTTIRKCNVDVIKDSGVINSVITPNGDSLYKREFTVIDRKILW